MKKLALLAGIVLLAVATIAKAGTAFDRINASVDFSNGTIGIGCDNN